MSQFNNILDVAEQLQVKRNYHKALKYLEKAQQIDQDDVRLNCLLARSLQETNQHDLSEYHYNKALKSDPNHLGSLLGKVSLYFELGNPESHELLSKTQLIHATEPSVYFYKSMHSRLDSSDIQTCISLLSKNDVPALHYALGSAFDKLKQYDRAYYHFVKANDVQTSYKSKLSDVEANLTINTYTSDLISGFSGHSSSRPIFVVGLPRSGTTLVEKVLSSHFKIGSGGELSHMYDIFRSLSKTPFSALRDIDDCAVIKRAEKYLSLTNSIEGVHFVDKMPDNINMVGFIKILFPNSKIVFCRRDKRDVALSCWQSNFSVIRWANNFNDMSNKFSNFSKVVRHWENIGIDWLDLSYEDFVMDFDKGVSSLLNFVGVEYDTTCLEFYKAKSCVKTASLSQVRKPLYTSSVGRWKNYDAFLNSEFLSLS